MTLTQIAAAVGANTAGLPEQELVRVSTDSRTVGKGDLFVCLKGPRFDGHEFAQQADQAGVAAIVAEHRLPDVAAPQLVVKNTSRALLDLGAAWRAMLQQGGTKIAAITGSAGKTTVKELLAQTLATQFRVHKSAGNFNNQVGLPMSLLAATGDEDMVVVEVGISKSHDMGELAPVAGPDLAVVHNIGSAHLEGLGSLQGVARAKAGLLEHMAEGGQGLVSRDYPELAAAALEILPGFVPMSATDPETPIYCGYLGLSESGQGGTFLLRLGDQRLEVTLPFHGAHFAENVAAAAGAAHLLGMGADAIAEALATAELPGQRFAILHIGHLTLIDDNYNANPLSMTRAIQAAAALAGSKPLTLVLGDMGELGDAAQAEHVGVGRMAGMTRPAAVVYRGKLAQAARRGLEEVSFEGVFAELSEGPELYDFLASRGLDRGVVLVKGSRSARMEEFVTALQEAVPSAAGEDN